LPHAPNFLSVANRDAILAVIATPYFLIVVVYGFVRVGSFPPVPEFDTC